MKRSHVCAICLLSLSVAVAGGCASGSASLPKTVGNETDEIDRISQALDTPPQEVYPAAHSAAPITAKTVQDLDAYTYRSMSLTDVMRIAMENSQVLRELGGTVLRNPDSIRTRYTQQLQNSDPRFGREAVLSEFDAQLKASAIFNNNDRIFNNSFFAGGATGFKQDLHDYQVELSKRTATGSELALRSVYSHDANNAPANTFRSAWNVYYEGEIRQPLLQGGGLEFNRIAGPNSTPGVYNGILVARANADINEADFEVAIRDFVSNVENAYWDLYFAYRDVDARRKAMHKALEVWNRRKALKSESDPAELALAKEQYYRFKADLDEAVAGRLVQGTQSRNGSTGGTLRGTGGLLVAERKLRLLMGLPTGDNTLIRPGEEPTMAEVVFDWDAVRGESLNQRAELRQQQARVRRREMELLAAKNFLNPRLDVFGRYRFRGFGDDLISDGANGGTTPASAIGNLATGDLQGWTAGVELSVPIGYRRAHAAVANAELQVARERAIHQEQQREVVHDLGNAVADVARAHQACRNNLNRYLAAEQALNALVANDQQVGRVEVDRILDAQRRAVEAEIRYFRARAEYAVALKNVHFEKGSLLEFNNVRMAEPTTPPTPAAMASAKSAPAINSAPPVRSAPPMKSAATAKTPPVAKAAPATKTPVTKAAMAPRTAQTRSKSTPKATASTKTATRETSPPATARQTVSKPPQRVQPPALKLDDTPDRKAPVASQPPKVSAADFAPLEEDPPKSGKAASDSKKSRTVGSVSKQTPTVRSATVTRTVKAPEPNGSSRQAPWADRARTPKVGQVNLRNVRTVKQQPAGSKLINKVDSAAFGSVKKDEPEGSVRLGQKPGMAVVPRKSAAALAPPKKKPTVEGIFGRPNEPAGSTRIRKTESAAFGVR